MPSGAAEPLPPCIHVIAGTNGAGKSTVIGAAVTESGAEYFNPDDAARRLRAGNKSLSQRDANIAAWNQGRQQLEQAIASRLIFAFETTLGGTTITRLLQRALADGIEVRMWYVGLTTADLHIARVRARVARGGHPIPSDKIRERFNRSRENLIRLLPGLTELRVFDNSAEGDPAAGRAPKPFLVLQTERGRIVAMCAPEQVPEWAKPLVAAALRSSSRSRTTNH